MSHPRHGVSRRAFFGQAATASLVPGITRPRQAWIIVVLGWEYNDEFAYPEGQHPQPTLYYERAEADAACRRLCEAFFADQSPEEFEVDWSLYAPPRAGERDFDESTVTWDEVRAAGFPDPYFVLELTHPEFSPP